MHEQNKNMDELRQLLAVALDDELTEEQLDRLTELLDAEPAARDLYARHMTLHAYLERLHVGADQMPPVRRDDSPARSPVLGFLDHLPADINWNTHPARFFTVATLLTLMVWCGFYFYIQSALQGAREVAERPGDAPMIFVAKLRYAVDAEWGGDQAYAPIVGAHLQHGRTFELKSGLAEIRFDSGANVVLEGPAEFTLDDENACRLQLGRLVARVSAEAKGFTVETPHATIIDLGTEFGVEVNQFTETEIAVLDGAVEARVGHAVGAESRTLRLSKGRSLGIARDGTVAERESGDRSRRFVRRLPKRPIHGPVLFDFGKREHCSDGQADTRWNDVATTVAEQVSGLVVSNALDVEGNRSGMTLSVNDPGPARRSLVALLDTPNLLVTSPGGIRYPASATRDGAAVAGRGGGFPTSRRFVLGGLIGDATYDLIFFGTSGPYQRTSVWTINGVSQSLATANNNAGFVVFKDVAPSDGSIDIQFSAAQADQIANFNTLEVVPRRDAKQKGDLEGTAAKGHTEPRVSQ